MKDKKKKGRAADITRYILIGVLAVLAVLLVIIMVNVYKSAVRDIDDSDVVIVYDTEAVTMSSTETEYESETKALEETETESETEVFEETETESETEVFEETETESETEVSRETETESDTKAQKDTENEAETAVYLTLNSACNFRSEASYTDANGNDTVITSYPAGTIVEFLEDVGGWYKVRINGVTGYMGAKFFD